MDNLQSFQKQIIENQKRIYELDQKFNKIDLTILNIEKDYEYMKKTLDSIQSDTAGQLIVINSKLDDIYKKNQEGVKLRLKQYDDMKNHMWKVVIQLIIAAVVGGIVTRLF